MDTETETKRPAQTFRKANIKGAVWENTGKDGTFYRVTFSRSYKDLEALADVAFQARLFIMKNK